MNIFEKRDYYKELYDNREYHKEQYDYMCAMIESVDLYFDSYDTEGKSVDEMMEEFFYVYGEYDITKRDFIFIAKHFGYMHKQVCFEGKRFFTLVKG